VAIPWFDTIIPAVAITGTTEFLSMPLGARTLLYTTASASFQILGLGALGGNVDGMVVVIQSVVNSGASVNHVFMHESASASPVNRFRNHNGANITSCLNVSGGGHGIGGATYFYLGSIQRWIMLSHT